MRPGGILSWFCRFHQPPAATFSNAASNSEYNNLKPVSDNQGHIQVFWKWHWGASVCSLISLVSYISKTLVLLTPPPRVHSALRCEGEHCADSFIGSVSSYSESVFLMSLPVLSFSSCNPKQEWKPTAGFSISFENLMFDPLFWFVKLIWWLNGRVITRPSCVWSRGVELFDVSSRQSSCWCLTRGDSCRLKSPINNKYLDELEDSTHWRISLVKWKKL